VVGAPRTRGADAKEATMPKLTDTQLVILSAAAKRKNGAVLPTPKSLKVKGTALTKTLEALHKRGLLEEKAASRQAAAWREAEDGRPMMLIITEAGLQAIDGAPAGDVGRQPTSTRAHTRKPRAKRKSVAKPKREKSASTARPGTKQALLIGLLKRKRGAAIDEIVAATGWQAHSVRGAISGTLKKKLGLDVTSESVDGRGRVYRIAGSG
jgi:hypothetical protein